MPTTAQAFPPRQGPRPLAFHLASAMTSLMSSLFVLPTVPSASAPWSGEQRAKGAELAAALQGVAPAEFQAAVGVEILARLGAMMTGIEAYRSHSYQRDLPEPPLLWQEGTTRLLDYGAEIDPGAPTALFVPSLVNRGYVLDLKPGRSLLRWLASQGLRPLLVDWGAPGAAESDFDLKDYIAGRLEHALDAALAGGGPVAVVGYCMGGNLALALALRRQRQLAALALLATPWDFHAAQADQARLFASGAATIDVILEAFGELPVDLLQVFFASLDPTLALKKFGAFARLTAAGPKAARRAEEFVALEDWLNDGVPLVPRVARECLVGWYGENTPGRGLWRLAGEIVDAGRLELPSLVVVPASDRIVPPQSARALAALIPGAETMTPPSGHIGMVVGSSAEHGLWQPLATWLHRQLTPAAAKSA
ncbi:MAG: alpha/beta fold hydrolase [Alphaproteobacteria bacterium]|nr:alpha/beta fold hydrolase [Alphaproteobacteria bacterium]HJP21721.1 alpha/beta fold hydrolase [Alphaproteobacteria bacterium]